MAVSERSREQVGELLSTLSTQYGSVPVNQTTTALPPATYERACEQFAAGRVVCAGVRLEDPDGRVLLVKEDDGTNRWAEPGGRVGADETLEAGAKRLVKRTTGLDCDIDEVTRVSIVGIGDERNVERPPVYQLQLLFSGVPTGGELREGDGVAAVEWWTNPPATVSDALPA
ncbi:NUDIX hydrolase [Haladaptatus sp. DJG-WS-42]|uniref:NUDIX hydrolase n=1 Tax=Haladaptatus sp. DJG-WS-42 TaxID=3120516 RepID=UPI0030CCABE3